MTCNLSVTVKAHHSHVSQMQSADKATEQYLPKSKQQTEHSWQLAGDHTGAFNGHKAKYIANIVILGI